MPGRNWAIDAEAYRYGYTGKESDRTFGEDSYDFGARIYSARLGRWMSVDPLRSDYPDLSPYNYVGNSPVSAVDPDGKLIIFINGLWGPPTFAGKGATDDYWVKIWINNARNAIGDHRQDPIFLDGS